MLQNPQIIKKDGKAEFVVIPIQEYLDIKYLDIKKMLEDLEDLHDLRKAKEDEKNLQSLPLDSVRKELNMA